MVLLPVSSMAQIEEEVREEKPDTTTFYIRVRPNTPLLPFKQQGDKVLYDGVDTQLKDILDDHVIFDFKRTFEKVRSDILRRTYFVKTLSSNLKETLLKEAPTIFEFAERVPDPAVATFYPDDYGLTNKSGVYKGAPAVLDYYDYLGVPQAWAYTTGSRDVIIGISDGALPVDDPDFKDKITVIRESPLAGGHGYSIAATAVAQGNNGYGIPGICYDCSVYATTYTASFNTLEHLVELSQAGARVINCSWISGAKHETAQAAINEMHENGTIIVAGAGNRGWRPHKGEKYYYPASYDNVISVTSVAYKYPTVYDNLNILESGTYYAQNIENYLGRSIGFRGNDPENEPYIWGATTATLNPAVDIAAPGLLIFSFGNYLLKPEYQYNEFQSTSMATPMVTGTIGLMLSLHPGLTPDEVESILKITSTNINYIPANRKFAGHYGSGALHTGRAVKMTHDLISPSEEVIIENQFFDRWDFVVNALSKQVRIRNQVFALDASLQLTAKQKIVLKPGTSLSSTNAKGIVLRIDPELEKQED